MLCQLGIVVMNKVPNSSDVILQIFGSDLDVVVKAQCFVSWAL
jgi:hypothetical protein